MIKFIALILTEEGGGKEVLVNVESIMGITQGETEFESIIYFKKNDSNPDEFSIPFKQLKNMLIQHGLVIGDKNGN